MSLVQLPIPAFGLIGASGSIGTHVLNDSDDRVAAIFRCPKAGTLDRIFVPINSKTGTVGVVRCGVQGVSGRVPDGSWLAGGNAYVDLSNPSVARSWQTLGSGVSVSKGDLVAAVILTQSGTFDGSNNLAIRTGTTMVAGTPFPPVALTYESSWAELTQLPSVTLRYSDGEILVPSLPIDSLDNMVSGWIAGADPLFRGNRFAPDIDCEFRGFNLCLYPDAGGAADFDLHLFEGTSFTPLVTVSVDVSELWRTGLIGWNLVPSERVTLNEGTVYRVAVEPKSSTAFQRFMRMGYLDSDTRAAVYGPLIGTTAPSGGPWTDADTQCHAIAPLIERVAAGGGGLIVHPGMTGGMRG